MTRMAGPVAALALPVVVTLAGCGSPATGSGGASPSTLVSAAPSEAAAPSASPSALPSAAEPTTEPSLDIAAARRAFEYQPGDRTFTVISTTAAGDATVRDVTYASSDGRSVSALLVSPTAEGHYPAAIFLHWYDTGSPDGNRTEFLDEATALAARGVVSLLPEQAFPWHESPGTTAHDRQAVIDQLIDLRTGLDALIALPEVDPDRVAVVGHDFGGMYAGLVGGLDERVGATVIMASVPHWADWFVRYWHPAGREDESTYRTLMLEVDPVTFLPYAAGPVLFQFAESDRYVNDLAATTWLAAAPVGSPASRSYPSNHGLKVEAAVADRDDFLAKALGFGE
jgi:dipeptidyl aminopeptidase/acylaminoacyl peptidase